MKALGETVWENIFALWWRVGDELVAQRLKMLKQLAWPD